MKRFGFFLAAGASLLVATAGCGAGSSGDDTNDAGSATNFIAFAKDFSGYHGWQSYDVTGDADLAGIHDGSTVIEYINHLPTSGLTEFPLGTIIVKEATGGTIPHELFAMVKRGGGYNPGAPGWAWYDLKNTDKGDDSVSIAWGPAYGPPLGDTYGGNAAAGCNTCHTACGNDAVCAKPLSLSNF